MTTSEPISTESLRLPEPERERWQLLRAGLQNIWEYDDQRFVCHRGRLLLRGRNESGKTKAIEVLLPFLLDADLSPQRLDPFGSMARPMYWNLINDQVPDVQVRIGYVWIEFGRRVDGRAEFCTIGAGLRAKRSKPGVSSWYFLTAQRIDRELDVMPGRAPLTRSRLEQAIAESGSVFDSRADYRRAVNQRIFGLPDDQYAALIETLLQLRRPQLSKSLQPEALSRILTASLPPLEAQVIGSLAEGFQRLDQHRAARERFAETHKAVKDFLATYRRYIRTVARAAALEMTRGDSAYQRARSELRQAREAHAQAKAERDELTSAIAALEQRGENAEERLRTLRSSEAYQAVEKLDEAEQQERSRAEAASRAQRALAAVVEQLGERQRELDRASAAVDAARSRLADARAGARQAASDAGLGTQHEFIDEPLAGAEMDVDAARGAATSVCAARGRAVDGLAEQLRGVRKAARAAERAYERLSDAAQAERDAEEAVRSAEGAEGAARQQFLDAVSEWLDALEVLSLDAGLRDALFDQPSEDMAPWLRTRFEAARAALDERIHAIETERRAGLRLLEEARAEFDALERATHPPPEPPNWRAPRPDERPGAPLYMLCDFREGAAEDTAARANIEAALEASGLLDAWITPDGQALAADTFDVVLTAVPREGATLLDVLVPVSAGGVEAEVIERVLRTIELVRAGSAEDQEQPNGRDGAGCGPCWVSIDGRFRVGPMSGAWAKDVPSFIGATARERERARRMSALERRIAELDEQVRVLESQRGEVEARRAVLRDEEARFPSLEPVLRARFEVERASAQLQGARGERARLRDAYEAAQRAVRSVVDACLAAAEFEGMSPWIRRLSVGQAEGQQAGQATRLIDVDGLDEDLDELRRVTRVYGEAVRDLVQAASELEARQREHALRASSAEQARAQVEGAQESASEADGEAQRARVRAATLRAAVGATRDELLVELRATEQEQREVHGELKRARHQKSEQDRRVGATGAEVDTAARREQESEAQREAAERGFRELAEDGFLSYVGRTDDNDSAARSDSGEGDDESKGPARWTLTDTLREARRIDAATTRVDASPEARDKEENRVSAKQQDLLRSVPADVRVLPQRRRGVLDYQATMNGREMSLLALADVLVEDIAARDRLLGENEQALFESFLSGETHEHLRSRLRQANGLVEDMNQQLTACPTASGRTLRLRWAVRDEAPPGTSEAIALLLRAAHLLSDANRSALRQFLQQRLDEARAEDGIGSLLERMLGVLDYRSWFTFAIEYRDREANSAWRRLTRKVHGAGSGGQKAVMLHLPLFAAAAAFYSAAANSAPRPILLDEAFAGIDTKIRAQLMKLLVTFDLDFIMTSYEEWGFYEELDGLSTYHLSREPGFRGVHAAWFLWDGARAVEMESR
ncbi:TIGR02680 family protein [Haliangium ochraceum]|uniref:TIGR02680 family protein n=1 Tax=Haliangium ochraceum (strain DSM 14365 / JCM 11303 / SMP-2) TaxID=502025 RepID=D0LNF1_HALO1|nr:TIGR02680 family protein [Haliangium ochraceum]ACY15328.1 conserved hypothetical protein [Haliangium ochraceum DSM 14365]